MGLLTLVLTASLPADALAKAGRKDLGLPFQEASKNMANWPQKASFR